MAVQETPWIAFASLALELELPDNVSGFQVGVRVLDSAFHAPVAIILPAEPPPQSQT